MLFVLTPPVVVDVFRLFTVTVWVWPLANESLPEKLCRWLGPLWVWLPIAWVWLGMEW